MTNFEQPIDRLALTASNGMRSLSPIMKRTFCRCGLPTWISKRPPRLTSLSKLLEHGILGYADTPDTLYTAISNWEQEHFKLAVRKKRFFFSLVS